MSEMVERVARALHVAIVGDNPDELIHHPAQKSWEAPTWPRWEQWEEAATAALEAIREPTVEQIRTICDERNDASSMCYAQDWRAMVEAALNPASNASRVGAKSDQGKDTRDEQTASLLSRLQAAQARIKVLEGALERLTGAVEWMREADDLPSPPATAEMLRSAWRSVGEAATAARSTLPQLGGENG